MSLLPSLARAAAVVGLVTLGAPLAGCTSLTEPNEITIIKELPKPPAPPPEAPKPAEEAMAGARAAAPGAGAQKGTG
jgi:hypothetical protein